MVVDHGYRQRLRGGRIRFPAAGFEVQIGRRDFTRNITTVIAHVFNPK